MEERNEQLEVRRKLRRSWGAFFGRFGRLTPVQLKTIPLVLAGRNVAVASATASGKTEAVLAPLAESLLVKRPEGLAVLHVTPTRALANDAFRRISEPLKELGLSCGLRTGERRRLQPERPDHFLITTVESLDSLICRFRKLFSRLQAVVLDELHLLDGTYRGDQLLVLLRRLEAGRPGRTLQYCALSATLDVRLEAIGRYFAPFEPVCVPGRRDVDASFVPSLDAAVAEAQRAGLLKLLLFANSRRQVEETAAALRRHYPARVVVTHYSSLSRREREEAEEFMAESRTAVCVATSSLEVGVDIGDIDAVVLVDPPPGPATFLQRIGRGNRRTGRCRVICVCYSQAEPAVYERLIRLAKEGTFGQGNHEPDLSVVVQQVFSLLFGYPSGMTVSELQSFLQALCTPGELDEILEHLWRRGLLVQRAGRWQASTIVMNWGERGTIHSNIPDGGGHRVVDVKTGRTIGTVDGPVDSVFVLGGHLWKVVGVRGSEILVAPTAGPASAPAFSGRQTKGRFWSLLPPRLRATSEDVRWSG